MNLRELYKGLLKGLDQRYSICSLEDIAQSCFHGKVFGCK